MDFKQDLWALMARCAFKEATGEEIQQLNEYFKEDPYLQQQYDWLLQVLQKQQVTGGSDILESRLNDLVVKNILRKSDPAKKINNKKRNNFNKRHGLLMAAAVTGFMVLTYFFFFLKKSNTSTSGLKPLLAVSTHNSNNRATILPDGSKVWLNTGSTLLFENNFKGKTREVRLLGEAYFDVVKDITRPFIVHANDINIQVLGTAFNVKDYDEDKEIQTTLYRGLVHITKTGDEHFQPIMLYPNQKLSIPKVVVKQTNANPDVHDIDNSIVLTPIDSTKSNEQHIETAWMYGRLEFKGEPLEEVANKMAHWYGVKFIFKDDDVKRLSFTGSFEKETLQQALHALQTANLFNYNIKNDEVIISKAQ